MNIERTSRQEEELRITETDVVGGGEILILIVYATKENDNLWAFPSPQIFNEDIYQRNKAIYDKQVKQFRLACEEL